METIETKEKTDWRKNFSLSCKCRNIRSNLERVCFSLFGFLDYTKRKVVAHEREKGEIVSGLNVDDF